MLSQPAPIPPTGQIHPFPPSSHPSPHLTVKFTPSRPAVILHLCWRPNSLLSTQRSSSTPPGGQIHPSQTSGHPLPHLAVKCSSPHAAVILPPFLWSNSPLPAQRSSSTPAGGQLHPFPLLLGVDEEGRRETGGGRRDTGGERREARDVVRGNNFCRAIRQRVILKKFTTPRHVSVFCIRDNDEVTH